MGSGYSGLYPSFKPVRDPASVPHGENDLVDGVDYNTANSTEIGSVVSARTIDMGEKMPITSSPNSVVRKKNGDDVVTERYYNSEGEPYIDIDYTDHGNPKTHPIVPHKHDIDYNNGDFKREEPGKEIV